MSTIPPEVADVDKWLSESGAARQLISASFQPGKGFHVSAFVVGYTMHSGAQQFSILTGDPTTDPIVARSLYGLISEYGAVTVRAYEYHEPLPSILPQGMAAGDNIQSRISNMDNWASTRTT